MKKLALIFRHAPHSTAHGREALDLAMLSASFEQEVSLIFVDEGILHLLPNQNSELIGGKDYIATFKALPLYDIERLFVCETSLKQLGINQESLLHDFQVIDSTSIAKQLQLADEVLVF